MSDAPEHTEEGTHEEGSPSSEPRRILTKETQHYYFFDEDGRKFLICKHCDQEIAPEHIGIHRNKNNRNYCPALDKDESKQVDSESKGDNGEEEDIDGDRRDTQIDEETISDSGDAAEIEGSKPDDIGNRVIGIPKTEDNTMREITRPGSQDSRDPRTRDPISTQGDSSAPTPPPTPEEQMVQECINEMKDYLTRCPGAPTGKNLSWLIYRIEQTGAPLLSQPHELHRLIGNYARSMADDDLQLLVDSITRIVHSYRRPRRPYTSRFDEEYDDPYGYDEPRHERRPRDSFRDRERWNPDDDWETDRGRGRRDRFQDDRYHDRYYDERDRYRPRHHHRDRYPEQQRPAPEKSVGEAVQDAMVKMEQMRLDREEKRADQDRQADIMERVVDLLESERHPVEPEVPQKSVEEIKAELRNEFENIQLKKEVEDMKDKFQEIKDEIRDERAHRGSDGWKDDYARTLSNIGDKGLKELSGLRKEHHLNRRAFIDHVVPRLMDAGIDGEVAARGGGIKSMDERTTPSGESGRTTPSIYNDVPEEYIDTEDDQSPPE